MPVRPTRLETLLPVYLSAFCSETAQLCTIKSIKNMSTLRNSVRLTGFLGSTPELKTTSTDKKYARLSLAIHESYKNKAGERVTETQWHQVTVWDKQADIAVSHLQKGSEVAIEGRLVNRSYTDKDGAKRYTTEIIVSEMLLLGKKA